MLYLDTPPLPHKRTAMAVGSTIKPILESAEREIISAVSDGQRRHQQRQNAQIIAAPMRELFDLLEAGEVHELNGQAVMRKPMYATSAHVSDADPSEWINIAHAINGWIDCWQRIDASISTYHMAVLAKKLETDKPITPRLVAQAREEFERLVKRMGNLPAGVMASAVTSTRIAWEFERIQKQSAS